MEGINAHFWNSVADLIFMPISTLFPGPFWIYVVASLLAGSVAGYLCIRNSVSIRVMRSSPQIQDLM